jgi:peptidyl-prolyl cis-trans isomerase D
MISWIQNHLIRHGRWIFISLLAVIIIAFVFTIGNTPGLTTDDSNYEERIILGIDVNNQRVMDTLAGNVGLSYLLRTQSEIRNENQFQSELANRIAQLYLIEKIGLPNPSQEELKAYIESLAYFQDESGAFDSESYNNFVSLVTVNPDISENQFVQTLIEDYKIEALDSVVEGPGFYTSPQSQFILDQQNTAYDLYNIKIDPKTFEPEIDTSDVAIKEYFETQQIAYETDEKIETSSILFPLVAHNFDSDAETLEAYYLANKESIDAEYRTEKEKFIDLDAEASDSETSDETVEETITYEMVADITKASWLAKEQNKAAEAQASEFVYTLYDQAIELDSQAFSDLLAAYAVSETDVEPYAASEIYGKALPSNLLQAGFSLNADRYYSDPYKTSNGFAVLLYKATVPSAIPSFESVADQVKADYIANETRAAFNAHGEAIQSQLEALVESGDDFQSGAEALGLTVEHYPEFNYNNQPEKAKPYEFQAVFRLKEGEVSAMTNYSEAAIITYLASKSVQEYEASEEEVERLVSNIKGFSKNTGLNGFYNELLSREIDALESAD